MRDTVKLINPPLAAEINALPDRVRQYVHDLEANADPAGDKARLLCLEENIAGLTAEIERLTHELEELSWAGAGLTEVHTCLCLEYGRLREALKAEERQCALFRGGLHRIAIGEQPAKVIARTTLDASPGDDDG